MLLQLFFKGILIGLILGVPVGAIGALTIQRTINRGLKGGFISGAGSCTADLIFAAVGIFGVSIISDFLIAHEHIIELVGGIFILAIAASLLIKRQKKVEDTKASGGYPGYYFSSFFAAILNPGTMVAFMIAFTAFDVTDINNMHEAITLLISVVMGTFTWWVILCGLVTLFRNKINDKIYKLINIVLGTLVALFGVVILVQGIIGLAAGT